MGIALELKKAVMKRQKAAKVFDDASCGGVAAREYALPLSVIVTDAASIIRTGDIITVNGEAGTVYIHSRST